PEPSPEPIQDRPVFGTRAHTVPSATPRDRLELLQELVVVTKLPQGDEQGWVSPRPTLDQLPQVPMRDGPTHFADGGEAGVEVVLRDEGLVLGYLLHR